MGCGASNQVDAEGDDVPLNDDVDANVDGDVIGVDGDANDVEISDLDVTGSHLGKIKRVWLLAGPKIKISIFLLQNFQNWRLI